MLQSDLCDYSDGHIVIKGTIAVTDPDNNVYDKKLTFKNDNYSLAALQKSIIHSLIMQKT